MRVLFRRWTSTSLTVLVLKHEHVSHQHSIGAWNALHCAWLLRRVLCAGYSRGCTLAYLCALWAKQTYGANVRACAHTQRLKVMLMPRAFCYHVET